MNMPSAPKLLITQGRVIDPKSGLDKITNIAIEKGKIIAIGKIPKDFIPAKTLDAKNLIITPGLIDLSFHIREPGYEQKGTIKEETYAAAKGGVTSICSVPDTNPIADTPSDIELIEQRVNEANYTKVYPLGALTKGLTGTQLCEYGDLKDSGCIGVSNAATPIVDTQIVKNAFEYATTFDLPIIIRPKDPHIGINGCAHESFSSLELGLAEIPRCAETLAVMRDIILAEVSGARVHFSCLSSMESIALISAAQKRGLPITADVAITHLHLTEKNLYAYDTFYHLDPPLRSETDQKALRKALKTGVIQSICSDHQPHEPAAKFKTVS